MRASLNHLYVMGAFIACVVGCCGAAASVLHVDDDAAAGGDGLSWSTAFAHLQDALAVAADPQSGITEIRVAQGGYFPDTTESNPGGSGDRQASFMLIGGVSLKGAYAGLGAPDPDARDYENFLTVFSGDLAENDLPDFERYQENSYHVVRALSLSQVAILDGVIIRSGNANFVDLPDRSGGGIFIENCAPIISNTTLKLNLARSAGAMHIGVNASPQVIGCTFLENRGEEGAGALFAGNNSEPSFTQCTFSDNRGHGFSGVATLEGTSHLFTDCTFSDNRVEPIGQPEGGAFFANRGTTDCNGCDFLRNTTGGTAGRGGAIYCDQGATLSLRDSTFEGNEAGAGGAIYNESRFTPMIVHRCTFEENIATDGPGGAIWTEAWIEAVDSIFAHNEANGGGGGAVRVREGEPLFYGCRFYRNSGSSDTLRITADENQWVIQCLFYAGGNAIVGGTNILNCTIVGNSGIGVQNAERIYNCIIWDNGDGSEGSQVAGNDLDLRHCLIENWSGALGGFGNRGGNPRFLDRAGKDGVLNTADDDFTLGDLSDAIDAGNDFLLPQDMLDSDGDGNVVEFIPFDFAGSPRCMDDQGIPDSGTGSGPIVDIGAFEKMIDSPFLQDLVGIEVIFGSLLDGGIAELVADDDDTLDLRSQFGFSAVEPNIIDVNVEALNTLNPVSELMLVFKGRLNNPGGSAFLRLRDWSDGMFDQVDAFPIGLGEVERFRSGIVNQNYISPRDKIDLSIKMSVVATFSASGFDAMIDFVEVRTR